MFHVSFVGYNAAEQKGKPAHDCREAGKAEWKKFKPDFKARWGAGGKLFSVKAASEETGWLHWDGKV